MAQRTLDRSLVWLAFPLAGTVWLFVGTVLSLLGDAEAPHLVVGGAALVGVSWLYILGQHRELNLWSFIVFSVAIGYPIRLTYVYLRLPDEEFIEFMYLRGNGTGYFFFPGVAASLALFLMTGAFVLVNRHDARPKVRSSVRFDDARLRLVVAVFAGLSVVGFVLFAQATGGFDAQALAVKRALLTTNDAAGASALRARGELRWLAGLGGIGYLFALVHLAAADRKLRTSEVALLIGLFIITILVPFYSSSRGDALAPIVATFFVLARTGRQLNARKSVAFLLAFVVILQAMTGLRSGGGVGEAVEAVAPSTLLEVSETIVLTRGYADFSKTAHLARLVPEQLPWDNGASIFGFALAPIPRVLWPSKPIISKGPILGQQIYGNISTSGVPPGALGELYWGFGYLGLVLGAPLLGAGLGLIERRFGATANRDNRPGLVLYASAFILAGDGLMAVGIGFAALDVVLAGAVVVLINRFARLRQPVARSGAGSLASS